MVIEDLKDEEQDLSYDGVEMKPSFLDGITVLTQWFNENVKYPVEASKDDVQGLVVVQFLVDKDCSITDVKPVQSDDSSLDKEAVRLIKSMPHWTLDGLRLN